MYIILYKYGTNKQTNFQRCVKPYDQKLLTTLDIAG